MMSSSPYRLTQLSTNSLRNYKQNSFPRSHTCIHFHSEHRKLYNHIPNPAPDKVLQPLQVYLENVRLKKALMRSIKFKDCVVRERFTCTFGLHTAALVRVQSHCLHQLYKLPSPLSKQFQEAGENCCYL